MCSFLNSVWASVLRTTTYRVRSPSFLQSQGMADLILLYATLGEKPHWPKNVYCLTKQFPAVISFCAFRFYFISCGLDELHLWPSTVGRKFLGEDREWDAPRDFFSKWKERYIWSDCASLSLPAFEEDHVSQVQTEVSWLFWPAEKGQPQRQAEKG